MEAYGGGGSVLLEPFREMGTRTRGGTPLRPKIRVTPQCLDQRAKTFRFAVHRKRKKSLRCLLVEVL